MKLDNFLPEDERQVKQEINVKIDKELKFIGSVRKIRGHSIFSYNIETNEIKLADIDRKVLVGLDGDPIYKERVHLEKNCIYVQALNKKNAIKRIMKMINSKAE